MSQKYIVRLTEEERNQLTEIVNKGKAAAAKIKRANILLKLDIEGPNWSDKQAAETFLCSVKTVYNLRQRLVEAGLEAVLERKVRATPPREPILDGEKEARLIQLACSDPPAGQACWTLKLLAEELVALEIVESISPQTVMRALKKTNSNHISASVG